MLLLYWRFCHQCLIEGPIKWEKVPNKSKRNDLSRAWFTAKEDSIHINTMTFCFWCVYFRRGAPKRKRATVFASKPNSGGDLIQFRFYIYSDNKDSLRVSYRLSKIFFCLNARHPPNATDCVNQLFKTEVFFPIFYPHTVWQWGISTDNWLELALLMIQYHIASYHDHWFIGSSIWFFKVMYEGTTMVALHQIAIFDTNLDIWLVVFYHKIHNPPLWLDMNHICFPSFICLFPGLCARPLYHWKVSLRLSSDVLQLDESTSMYIEVY